MGRDPASDDDDMEDDGVRLGIDGLVSGIADAVRAGREIEGELLARRRRKNERRAYSDPCVSEEVVSMLTRDDGLSGQM